MEASNKSIMGSKLSWITRYLTWERKLMLMNVSAVSYFFFLLVGSLVIGTQITMPKIYQVYISLSSYSVCVRFELLYKPKPCLVLPLRVPGSTEFCYTIHEYVLIKYLFPITINQNADKMQALFGMVFIQKCF